MKRLYLFIFFIQAFLLRGIPSYSQQNGDRVDFQTWTDITLTYFKTQKFSFGGDAGLRGIVSSKDWNSFYIRPTVHYKFTPIFKLSGGIGLFNTFNKSLNNTYELRFFQDLQISWPHIGWLDFYHRFRFEQRLFFYENLDNDLAVRGRYLIRARTTNFKLIGKKKGY